MRVFSVIVLLGPTLIGCQSAQVMTDAEYKEKYLSIDRKIPPPVAMAIRSGMVVKGMLMEEAEVALGFFDSSGNPSPPTRNQISEVTLSPSGMTWWFPNSPRELSRYVFISFDENRRVSSWLAHRIPR